MNLTEKWKRLAGGHFGKEKFMLIGLVGLLLFVIVLPTGNREKKELQNTDTGQQPEGLQDSLNLQQGQSADSYVSSQEERLTELLQQMEGVGKVKVMLTIERSAEALVLYEEDITKNTVTEQDAQGGQRNSSESVRDVETVYGKDETGENTPYVVQTIEPVIEGVVVIAQGGGNDDIRKSITEVVQALFGIEAHKIKVVKMKS